LTDTIFDTLLFNEKNEITECSIFNIAVEFFEEDEKTVWKTPEVKCGKINFNIKIFKFIYK
jgi:branched-subunit amino acid aminotransferase/4-amino-4-deoxychorismate lyase